MAEMISGQAVAGAMQRAAIALVDQSEYLTSLDQALGDGDMGISMGKIGKALQEYAQNSDISDIGKFLGGAGMATNKAAPSTMGTLLATALMRAGKQVMGKAELAPADLATIFQAADQGMQERGKARPGDKTIIDALHPASEAFVQAIEQGVSLSEAGAKAITAAEAGRDSVTPLRSRVGRASWVGERTEGQVDPGCAMFVIVLKAIAG
jgi:dihydroxyacetone kinase